jgi:hypothetical protein
MLSYDRSNIPDYLTDKMASEALARKLREYYLKQGRKDVKIWVEADLTLSDRKLWVIRSSIVFDCSSLRRFLK